MSSISNNPNNPIILDQNNKDFEWVCNECGFPNFTSSVSEEEIELELHSCIRCGGFEFHKNINNE